MCIFVSLYFFFIIIKALRITHPDLAGFTLLDNNAAWLISMRNTDQQG